MSRLVLSLFGAPRVEFNSTPVGIRLRKALALLAYLAVERRVHTRDAVADLLWPGYGQTDARANLRRTLSALQGVLPGQALVVDRQQISLNWSADIWVDVREFHRLTATLACSTGAYPDQTSISPAALADLEYAVSLYTADFLTGFTLDDAPGFDDWQRQEAESLHQMLANALDRLAAGYTATGQLDLGLVHARHRVDLAPFYEPAQRQLMRLYALNGQPAAALRQYEACVRQLQQELGVEPDVVTTQLRDDIRRGQIARQKDKTDGDTGEQPVGPNRQMPVRRRLPAQPTALIGRETELAEVRRLLLTEPDCRLLTLLGPGGIGKTRLALAVAESVDAAFPDGVVFVSFTGVNSVAHLDSTLAEATQFTFYAELSPRQQLLNYFRTKHILLVMDNFEHLLDGVNLFTDLLCGAPNIKLLVTSRVRLTLQEEWTYDVAGLSYPEAVGGPRGETLETLENYGAFALFMACTRRSRAGYTLTANDAPHILRLCQLVGGMPLALELAAIWMRMMSPAEIVRQIATDLDFLGGGLRNLPERHRSLRRVLDHSWELLAPQEQDVFRKLAIFRGGFNTDAAKTVAGATMPLLLGLIDKSLIRPTENGRYDLHELLRQYAEEKLRAMPEQHAQVTAAHATFYARLLADRQPELHRYNQQAAAAEIALDLDNIRQAWPFRAVIREHDLLWMAGGALLFFIELRGLWRDFETAFAVLAQELRRDLAQTQEDQTAFELKLRLMTALANQSAVALRLGNAQAAARLLAEYNALFEELEPRWPYLHCTTGWYSIDAWRGWSAYIRGLVAAGEGAYTTATAHLLAAIPHLRAAEMFWGVGGAELVLGQVARSQGHYNEARAFLEASLATNEELGDRQQLASVLDNLGRLALLLGNWATAADHCRRSLALQTALNDPLGIATSWRHLGEVALAQGDYAQARQCYERSLQLCLDIGHRLGEASCLAHLGELALVQGNLGLAKQQLAEGLAIRRQVRHRIGVAQSGLLLAQVLHELGEGDSAQALIEQSLNQAEGLGSRWLLAQAYTIAGLLAQAAHHLADAEAHFEKALTSAAQLQAPPAMLRVLTYLAPLLIETGRTAQAGQLLATVLAHPAADYPTKARAGQVRAAWVQPLAVVVDDPPADLHRLVCQIAADLHAN
ncbi:MAG: tetratricopeptide repeat protein [Caldilinea sp. CFX5]|nr:tetratricopeptide repeat protein [Caldilinea sp. CFX5]